MASKNNRKNNSAVKGSPILQDAPGITLFDDAEAGAHLNQHFHKTPLLLLRNCSLSLPDWERALAANLERRNVTQFLVNAYVTDVNRTVSKAIAKYWRPQADAAAVVKMNLEKSHPSLL